MGVRHATKVLLVGWDAADWQLISPLLDAGMMPCLNKLVNQGAKGDLASEFPLLSPLLWTSIATGHRADRHGILGFTEPDPTTGRLRPVGSPSRKVKALWNILSQSGLRTHVVGWFASHPAERINGVCVSELIGDAPVTPGVPWPMAPGTVHPARLEEAFTNLRLSMSDLVLEQLLPFVPRAKEIDHHRDPRLSMLAKCLAKCATVHAAATWAIENEPWDFAAIFYDLLDHLGHLFMPFHPPRREGIPEQDFEIYRDVMVGACRFLDMTLDRLLYLAGPEATVVLVSDHGFHCREGRPAGLQLESFESASAWHRPFGVFCAAGPGIVQDELIHGASVLDITPTILTLLGLPVGDDMAGRALVESFQDPTPPDHIPSWEDVPGEGGMWPPGYEDDPWEAKLALQQLAALGYIEAPLENEERLLQESRLHQQLNLARVHMAAGRYAEAIPLLKELRREVPLEAMYSLLLATCLAKRGEFDDASALLDEILAVQSDRAGALLLYAEICLAENQPQRGLEWLSRAEKLTGRTEATLNWLGRSSLLLKRPAEAETYFLAAIERNAQNAHAQLGLALARLELKRPQEAADAALNAVGLSHFLPQAHLALGIALAQMGRLDRAVQALQISLSQQPDLALAKSWLNAIGRVAERRKRFAVPLHPGQASTGEPTA